MTSTLAGMDSGVAGDLGEAVRLHYSVERTGKKIHPSRRASSLSSALLGHRAFHPPMPAALPTVCA
jgi:hypothetical protein